MQKEEYSDPIKQLIGNTVKFTPNSVESKMILENPVTMDFSKCLHTTIIAASGKGKSYLIRVLVECETDADLFTPLIFDPLGIFSSLKDPNPDSSNKQGYDVIILVPEGNANEAEGYDRTFTFSPKDIDVDTFAYTFDLTVNGQEYNLYRKGWKLCKKENLAFTLFDLKEKIKNNAEEWGYQERTVEALLSKVDALEDLGIVGSGLDLVSLLSEEKPLVFDFSSSTKYTSRVFISVMAEILCKYRRTISKQINKNMAKGEADYVDSYFRPLSFFVDEAHMYFPGNEKLEDLCRMGRNIGVKITAVSQSANLNQDLFANTLYWFVGPISLDKDIEKIAGMLPLTKDVKTFKVAVKSLLVGCFIYFNAENKGETEKTIRVRKAKTLHMQSTEIKDEEKWIMNRRCENKLHSMLIKKGKVDYDQAQSVCHDYLGQYLKVLIDKHLAFVDHNVKPKMIILEGTQDPDFRPSQELFSEDLVA